jgi:hypothetical protein
MPFFNNYVRNDILSLQKRAFIRGISWLVYICMIKIFSLTSIAILKILEGVSLICIDCDIRHISLHYTLYIYIHSFLACFFFPEVLKIWAVFKLSYTVLSLDPVKTASPYTENSCPWIDMESYMYYHWLQVLWMSIAVINILPNDKNLVDLLMHWLFSQ